jgi:LL-diaminopimelate aminotransferase
MRKVIVDPAERLQLVGPTAQIELEQVWRRMRSRGDDVIDLGRFVPDLAVDPALLEALRRWSADAHAFHPAPAELIGEFKATAARWFAARFGVKLNPRRAILPTAGIKQAIHYLTLALVNPGDRVGVPDPAYPFYRAATVFVGGRVVPVPLKPTNDFLPNLGALDAARTNPRILFLNYPNNPTSTPPDRAFFTDLVRWARKHNVIVVHDFAYGEIYYDQSPPPSLLSVPYARQVAVELHSFTFTYNLPGLRLGFAAGHPEALALLEQCLTRLAGGLSALPLRMGIEALQSYERIAAANNAEYVRRRQAMTTGLDLLGWTCRRPQAGGFCWLPVPRGRSDERLARRLLSRAHVLVAPGSGFGEGGEGYLRFSVAKNADQIKTAFERIGKLWPQRLKQMRQAWGSSGSRG